MAQQEQFLNPQSKRPSASSPPLPWRTRIALSIISAVTNYSSRQNGTVNRRLLGFFALKTPANPNPVNGVKSSDVTVDPSRHLWFRLFVPTTDESRKMSTLPIIVFFHGGGFVYLSADGMAYDAVCRRFARKIPAVVVSVNYRLAPEHRYPAQYDDGFDVLKFLDDEKNRGILPDNVNLSCCFVAGDSAGGNLAHHMAKRASESSSSFKTLKVIGLVAIQPFFGGEERTEAETRLAKIDPLISVTRTDWTWKAFLPPGEGMDRDHEAINVSGPRAADISKLDFPATVVVVGGFDSLQDWQRRYYEWLKKSGKEVYLLEYPTMVHAFYIFPELPESTHLISEIKDFIHKQCSKL
ncbi:putative carboxylesterase 18 [Nicotiana tabacum]|uniref:Carboxylesterase 18 n=2 Tax=Nicotiana TaxID=4085 RepID=A0A1S4D3Q1_TOBAC|nr:PREDICTED: probable carboxylesterase 18 [Nicotiana sylvestris]XP_016507904.1 PREDICTED: probable carboxylesterase 18 [Nicotiana tabacum]